MRFSKLTSVVFQNARRNHREFLISGFGIVVGVAALVAILGFSMGVRNKVLEVFPLERVEVIAPKASMLGVDMTKRLDDSSTVKIIEEQKKFKVESTVPRMAIAFPVAVSGYFEGARLVMDFVGDGVNPDFVREDNIGEMFKDWEADELKDPSKLKQCTLPGFKCDGLYYCDKRDMKCHHRVPVVISRNLIEIYNNQFAKSRGLPMIDSMLEFIAKRGGLEKMRLYIDLGESAVSMNRKPLQAKPRRVEGVLLGISNRAVPIGATVPIEYVKRWNKEFVGEAAATAYSSIIVTLAKKDDVAPFGKWLHYRDAGEEGRRRPLWKVARR
jgi:hypothetical protein